MPLPDTRDARSAILSALRGAAPAAPQPAPDLTPYLAGPFGRGSLGAPIDPASLVQPFEAAARGWRAEVLHARPGQWVDCVHQALAQRGCRRVAVGAGLDGLAELEAGAGDLHWRRFDQPIEAWKAELFDDIDAAVTGAEAGIADTGTLVLRPGPNEPRTLSLVPPLHVALLRTRQLVASLPAAWRDLDTGAGMPTNLLLVSGPSKTADIQQVLAYGAHGPKELVIVLIDDLTPPVGGDAR